jgi:hypothetical protein
MPITFRCDKCRNKLSTAKRKAGSTVACPNCGGEVRVPTADKLDRKVEKLLASAAARAHANGQPAAEAPIPEPEPPAPVPPPPPAKPPAARRVKPAALPSPAKLNDLPLFEREDFAEMLEKDAEAEEGKDPLPLPDEPPPPPDGFLVTRGTATMVMVAVVVLLGLAFAIGYLVGSSRG